MLIYTLKLVRATVQLLWVIGTLALLSVVVLQHGLPAVNHELFIVRGASMEPAIPIGSAVVVGHVDANALSVGDVITFRGGNDIVVTHRIVSLPTKADPTLHTKGDASESGDPIGPTPADVIGRVDAVLPVAGVFMLAVSSVPGAVLTLGTLGALLISVWFLDELMRTMRRSAKRRSALTPV
jgi:signal peptidase